MSEEGESASASGTGLENAGQQVRSAVKYLIATFGAVGAVLVSGLSLTALPSGRHPWIAVVAVLVAVVAIVVAIALAIQVMVPKEMTLSQLARLNEEGSDGGLATFLGSSEELFGGCGTNVSDFRIRYLQALKDRADAYQAYLDDPKDKDKQKASEVASARAEFLDPVVGVLLDVAVFYQLRHRFSDAFPKIAAAAVVVVIAAAVYAWASAKPAGAPTPKPMQSAKSPNCVAYYLKLDRLADDDWPGRHPSSMLFPLDPQARACGFRSEASLTRFVVYLSRR
jgi:hypothetical protein